jgi:hypothetical protein
MIQRVRVSLSFSMAEASLRRFAPLSADHDTRALAGSSEEQ